VALLEQKLERNKKFEEKIEKISGQKIFGKRCSLFQAASAGQLVGYDQTRGCQSYK
jgi:hypothetical protein